MINQTTRQTKRPKRTPWKGGSAIRVSMLRKPNGDRVTVSLSKAVVDRFTDGPSCQVRVEITKAKGKAIISLKQTSSLTDYYLRELFWSGKPQGAGFVTFVAKADELRSALAHLPDEMEADIDSFSVLPDKTLVFFL